MIWLKNGILLGIGLCSGGVIAAGVFAFIAVIGLIPRLAGRTHTAGQIRRYEDGIVLGGTAGNLLSLYGGGLQLGWSGWPGLVLTGIIGAAAGVFVGCLVMSLAETLDAIPALVRRVKLSVGLPWMILALALGKMAGSLLFFGKGFGS